ncbi:hypothetical protein CA13_26010 [Planctomycetes bacterium CA13]|uniref:Uncharacterized protein n=1 Tax=Novipirellula herctigrandis TaxID=2527986 RepID=A0A5C5Z3M1_9BACT|nr:hypothetical protein CA13_26010 [Planctomycetes bacterium CA13]
MNQTRSRGSNSLQRFLREFSMLDRLNAVGVFVFVAGIGVFNFLVDPYNLRGSQDIPLRQQTLALAENQRLWKLAEFRHEPCQNILIGDSRMRSIGDEVVRQVTDERYYNFAYGGATLADSIETFWFATKQTQLQNVVIGVNFDSVDAGKQWNLVKQEANRLGSPAKYYLNPSITMASWNLVAESDSKSERPPLDRDIFWREKLAEGERTFHDFVFAKQLMDQLREIGKFCGENSIRLNFVIFPTHQEYHDLIDTANLSREFDSFVSGLRQIAPTRNWDVPSEVTSDRANFRDPVHFITSIGKEVLASVICSTKPLTPKSD